MQTEEMRLDGNAAAGILREVFTREMTAAVATCVACRGIGPIGGLLAYGHGMGVTLRCPTCGEPVVRIARTPGFIHLDLSGVSLLTIPEGMPPA